MRELGEAAVEEPPYRKWPLVVAIVVAIVGALIALPSLLQQIGPMIRAGDWASVLGYIEGSSLFIAGVAWLVLYFADVRRRGPEHGLTHFIILFVVASAIDISVLALGYWTATNRTVIASGTVTTIQTDNPIDTVLIESRAATAAALSPTGGFASLHTQAPGEAGRIARAAKALLTAQTETHRAHRATIDALGYPRFAEPQQMTHDLAGAMAKLRKARAINKTYRAKEDANFATYRAVLASADAGPVKRSAALGDFDAAVDAAKPLRDRIWNLEDSIFVELEAMDSDLAHPKGPWANSGRGITFSSRYDLDDYDAHIRKVNALTREEMQARLGGQITPPVRLP